MSPIGVGSLVALALSALAYFTGWIYLNDYFGVFGVSLSDVNPPLQHYFIYAFASLLSWARSGYWIGWILLAGLGCFAALALWPAQQRQVLRNAALSVVGVLVSFAAFALARHEGAEDARTLARGDSGRRAFIVFSSGTQDLLQKRSDRVLEWNSRGELRLVWQDKDYTYVVLSYFDAGKVSSDGRVVTTPTYRFPASSIEYMMLVDVSRMGG